MSALIGTFNICPSLGLWDFLISLTHWGECDWFSLLSMKQFHISVTVSLRATLHDLTCSSLTLPCLSVCFPWDYLQDTDSDTPVWYEEVDSVLDYAVSRRQWCGKSYFTTLSELFPLPPHTVCSPCPANWLHWGNAAQYIWHNVAPDYEFLYLHGSSGGRTFNLLRHCRLTGEPCKDSDQHWKEAAVWVITNTCFPFFSSSCIFSHLDWLFFLITSHSSHAKAAVSQIPDVYNSQSMASR